MTQDYSVGYERLCNCLVFLLPVFKKTSLREVLCTVSDIIWLILLIFYVVVWNVTYVLVTGFYINGRHLVFLNFILFFYFYSKIPSNILKRDQTVQLQ
jgi:hypothetical protein